MQTRRHRLLAADRVIGVVNPTPGREDATSTASAGSRSREDVPVEDGKPDGADGSPPHEKLTFQDARRLRGTQPSSSSGPAGRSDPEAGGAVDWPQLSAPEEADRRMNFPRGRQPGAVARPSNDFPNFLISAAHNKVSAAPSFLARHRRPVYPCPSRALPLLLVV
jgi:hypothetical protein